MYSESSTATDLERIEAAFRLKLHRYTPEESAELTDYLTRLHEEDKLVEPSGAIHRKEHAAFIRNERLLFQWDFQYALRYIQLIQDSGGCGPLVPWESQRLLLRKVAALEDMNLDKAARGERADGILIADHKGGRQLGHTAIARALIWHRILSHPYTRAATIAVDETGLHKVYEKDELLFNRLPFFLQPDQGQGKFLREKDQHWNLSVMGSSLTYYQSQQRSGVGVGLGTSGTYDVAHATELATYAYPDMLEMDFFPTLPQNPRTLCILETTAFGRGNWWHLFSEAVRHGRKARWTYLFIPFYAEPTKYRRTPPADWSPSESTLLTARKIEDTSTEFVGKPVILERDQLYWWESSYADAVASNALNKFLSNYAPTPEISYQHTSASALSPQILDWMRSLTRPGEAYIFEPSGVR
jgi:hypothetical protein